MRTKVNVNPELIETQADLLGTVADVAKLMLRERDLKNQMDGELKKVRDRYDERLQQLTAEIETRTELCADYAVTHPDLFPKDRKSIDLVHAIIGFRTGMPRLKLLLGWKWDAVLERIKQFHWAAAVRVKEEVDKDYLIAHRNEYALKEAGLKVIQDETFFIEPKLEEQAAGVKVEA